MKRILDQIHRKLGCLRAEKIFKYGKIMTSSLDFIVVSNTVKRGISVLKN